MPQNLNLHKHVQICIIITKVHRIQCGPGQHRLYSNSLRAEWSGDRTSVGGGGASFFISVHIGPGAHPASYTMGTGPFPGVKRPGRGVDHPPQLAPKLKNEQKYTSTSLLVLRRLFQGEIYLSQQIVKLLTSILMYSFLLETAFVHNSNAINKDKLLMQIIQRTLLKTNFLFIYLLIYLFTVTERHVQQTGP